MFDVGTEVWFSVFVGGLFGVIVCFDWLFCLSILLNYCVGVVLVISWLD